jgi:flagellar basal body-associated protein FliL
MTFPEDVDNSNAPSRLFGRRLILAIIIVLVAGLTFGLWFFFISDSNNAAENSDIYLPPNCYYVNGKQTCPPKS